MVDGVTVKSVMQRLISIRKMSNLALLGSPRRIVQAYAERTRRRQGLKILKRMEYLIAKRPLDINIETSNFCAASCVFCPNSKVKRRISNMEMPLFQKICEEYAEMGGGALGISSMQSDLFSDKMLLQRIGYLKKLKGKFYVYSTTYLAGASKLDDAELEFLLTNFDLLQISIGGADKESYRALYGVNAFDTVRSQLLRVKKIVETKQLPIKLCLYLRTTDPERALHSDLVKELGNTFATVEARDWFFSWGGIIRQSDLPEGARLIIFDNSTQQADCAVASASMSINVDGSVVGCGCVDWNSRHIVGNVKVQSLKEVWQSKEALQFRKAFSKGQIPDLCKDCSLYISVTDAFSRPPLQNYKPIDGLYYLQ
jgi:radical SAM protein with 4Fe4S-binding SPASM domain